MDTGPCYVTIDAMTFANRFREARQKAGLTQQQVAEACGVTDGAVSAWEKGVAAGISAETLFCAADLMGVDPRWLATGSTFDATSEEIASRVATLPAEQRQAVLHLIRSLKR